MKIPNSKIVLVVEGNHLRRRAKFIEEPLRDVRGVQLRVVRFSNNIIFSIFKSAWFAFRNRDVDIVLSCDTGISSFVWLIFSKTILSASFVLRLGGNPEKSIIDAYSLGNYSELPLFFKLKIWMDKFILRHTRHLIVVSHNLECELKPLLHRNCRVYVVPQYIDFNHNIAKKSSTNGVFQLLTTTNLNFRGKSESLKLAIQQLLSNSQLLQTPIEWNICGGGLHLYDVIQFLNAIPLPDGVSIKIEGFQNDLDRYYSVADIFVYTSYLDGLPNVILEAMSHGLPIIVNRELAPNIDGEVIKYLFLFDLNTDGSLIEAINTLNNCNDLRLLSGHNNRVLAQSKYSRDIIGRELVSVLNEVIGKSTITK